MPEIIASLQAYGINAERKSIYTDMENLRLFGLDIIGEKMDKSFSYYIGNRQFELAELKLLVDSVQASKFITAKKSNQLIKKIEGLASQYEAAQLQRQVYTTERIKAGNEGIYYNVDQIHTAIASNQQIKFHYFNWDVNKKQVLRKDGAYYQVSPWALSWDDENYYLVAYDSAEEKIKHFRVDKMLHISALDEKREGSKKFQAFDMGAYAKKMFGMFGGDEEMVKIICKNELAGVMIDRFGQDVSLIKEDAEHFSINVRVAVSSQFLSWVMALGDGAKIVSPERVVDKVREEIKRLAGQYGV
jgi:predicted DNA-binding transcriptional regulator YafY